MSKICVFWKKEKKTAHLECFVCNFHDFPTVVDYSCTGLFSREICEQDLCFVEERGTHSLSAFHCHAFPAIVEKIVKERSNRPKSLCCLFGESSGRREEVGTRKEGGCCEVIT